MEPILENYMHMQFVFPLQSLKLETHHQEEVITLQSNIQSSIFTHIIFNILKYNLYTSIWK